MWSRKYQKHYSGVPAEAIWCLWTDVNQWHVWHDDLDYCKMSGSFTKGNYFMLKPKGMSPVKITLTDVQEGKQFTDCTRFFGAKMYDTHEVIKTPDGIIISNYLVMTGPLKWLWVKLVGKGLADSTPQQVDTIAHLAREGAHG